MELKWGVDWGLTAKGFIVPSYDEVLDSVEDDFISRFGQDIVLTSNSNFGIFARLMAWREWIMMQELQRTYYSAFINTATETALDRIGANIGFPRKSAKPAEVDITVTTNGQYLINAGEQFETDDGFVFELENDLITEQQSDGSWSGTGTCEAVDDGADGNVPVGAVDLETNPDENVLSVTNKAVGAGGQDYEQDDVYRKRLIEENTARPSPTCAGIESALMNLNGIREVGIVQNPGNATDSYGNPPFTVHIYCLGGKQEDIAETLANYIAAGIHLVGTQQIEARDATGKLRQVNFDFAKNKPVFVSAKITTNDGWDVDDGASNVKQAIADYINNLEMGDTVHITKMYPAVYQIDGIDTAEIQIGTAAGSYSLADIPCDKYEAPSCDINTIEVTTNGD